MGQTIAGRNTSLYIGHLECAIQSVVIVEFRLATYVELLDALSKCLFALVERNTLNAWKYPKYACIQ
jgi:hypothetical protein